MDAHEIAKLIHDTLNEHLNKGTVTRDRYKKLKNTIAEYFEEYRKKYDDDPANSWLAKDLDEDRFFDYGMYANPSEVLQAMDVEFNK